MNRHLIIKKGNSMGNNGEGQQVRWCKVHTETTLIVNL